MRVRNQKLNLCATLSLYLLLLAAPLLVSAEGRAAHHAIPASYKELINESLAEKSGLTFFLNGQSIPVVVTKILDDNTIEGRSQQYDRVVIRLQRVNAIAKQ